MLTPRRPVEWWVILLKPWPLLIAAVVAFGCGLFMLRSSARAEDLAVGMVIIGAMLLGGWMTLLAGHGYEGDSKNKPDDTD